MEKENSQLIKGLNQWHIHLIISVVGALSFIPFLGNVHLFDWDEINFAEAAREMIIRNDWSKVTINYLPFIEKPPLFFWLQALSMKIFGINEFAARFPNALVGIISLNVFYHLGEKLANRKIAILWVLTYLGSLTPHFYFKSGLIDPSFNLFIFISFYHAFKALWQNRNHSYALAGLFSGLAVLTKGPVAVLILLLSVLTFYLLKRKVMRFSFSGVFQYFVVLLVISFFWVLPEVLNNGLFVIREFILYQLDLLTKPVASHGQPFYYHSLVLWFLCFPAVILALPILFRRQKAESTEQLWLLMMKVLFWVVLVLFSLVKTKIVHYSSLCYPPATFMAAIFIAGLYSKKYRFTKGHRLALALTGAVLVILIGAIPLIMNKPEWKDMLLNSIKDKQFKAGMAMPNLWKLSDIYPVFFLFVSLVLILTIRNKNAIKLYAVSSIMMAVFIFSLTKTYLPKIENHTQGGLVELCEIAKENKGYIHVFNYRSYAPYFYGEIMPQSENSELLKMRKKIFENIGVSQFKDLKGDDLQKYKSAINEWYLSGNIDKTVNIICRDKDFEKLFERSDLKWQGSMGGFSLFTRKAAH